MPIQVPTPESLFFRPATVGEKLICWTRNSASWAGPLTLPQYIKREEINGSQEITRDGQITYWVLTTKKDPPAAGSEHEDDILCACESLKRPVALRTAEGVYKEGYGYGIASVYTHGEARGHGLAAIMMERLAAWFDTDENCLFSTLYSDVDKKFYDKRGGWVAYSSRQLELAVSSSSAEAITNREVKLLDKEAVKPICDADEQAVKDEIKAGVGSTSGLTRVTHTPSFPLACWHFGAEEYIGQVLEQRVPTVKGAAVGQTVIYWVHEFTEKKIIILRVISRENTDDKAEVVARLTALLKAAVTEARDWGFKKVVAWVPSDELLLAASNLTADGGEFQVNHRDTGSIPCLRWPRADRTIATQWQPNEKFEWC